MHRDLDDLARNLRYHAHHENAHAGVARVGRQAISDHRPPKKHDADDEDDQCPAPKWVAAPGRGRRSRDPLGLRNPHFVHAEYPWLTPVPRWTGIHSIFAAFPAVLKRGSPL